MKRLACGLGLALATAIGSGHAAGQSVLREESGTLRTFGEGVRLARWAEVHRDAQAMLVAVTMIGDPLPPPKGWSLASPNNPIRPIDRAQLLARAREFAGSDRYMLARIDALSSSATKGVVGGPVAASRELRPQATWSIRLKARGGEPLTISMVRDEYATPILELREATGRLLCQRIGPGLQAQCRTLPAFAAEYEVRIINPSQLATDVTIASD